ncbi:hypothetical protein [Actinomadura sp. KC345]|uniref:hypothetical protein n=1 Tax=Actinomadura sp. KC345 TaxID=2530371 RepID=UPI001404BA8F|nr:hypothetical protein [Actinomadura sp. KC345]
MVGKWRLTVPVPPPARRADDEPTALEDIAARVAGDRLPELPPELRRLMPEVA